jgi:hypothetical protein
VRRLLLALLASLCLFACPRVPVAPVPDSGTGGVPAATGGSASTGGQTSTGGSASAGGSTVAIEWPACPRTLQQSLRGKRKLGLRTEPHSLRLVQPWHDTGVKVQSVFWKPNCTTALAGKPPCIPYDQGDLGACTVAAEIGELSTLPFHNVFSNSDIPKWYTWVTANDPFARQWPPDDTGSDGPSAEKAAVHFGYSTGYRVANTLADMHALLQSGPGGFGSNWHTGMFAPVQCHVSITGAIEGGHRYEYVGFDKENGKEWFRNSWGPGFGDNGYFWISSDDVQTLIYDGADAQFANSP